jgi:hypothetical protein
MTNENNENQTPQDEPQSQPETQASQEPAPQQPAAPVQQTQASTGGGGEVGKKIQDMANMQVGGFSLCKIIALAGAGLLFLSFFLPWWGQDAEKIDGGNDQLAGLMQEAGPSEDDFSGSAYGWDMGRAITTFIFSFLIAGSVLAVMFVEPVKPYAMFILGFATILAFVVFILTLTVWFGTPGDTIKMPGFEIDRGVSFGTFVALFGALGVLAGAGYEAVMGMMGFFKAQQAA